MIAPFQVHDALSQHLLVDGFEFVLDLDASRGARLVDARDGSTYLDMFTFFASSALGMNHPALADERFRELLGRVAVNKPSNSDVYTTHFAEFVRTFVRVLGDPALPRLFFVEGGALAIENALKVAFDWKSRRNERAGRDPALGTRVLHLTKAFHGRSGYALSLTNTEPVKVARFPKFDWPRLDVPVVRFPLERHLEEVLAAERHALGQAVAAFEAHAHDIACFVAEPIQGEGGDNHLRAGFLRSLQELCHAHDALFVLDEVQSGCGLTGTAWAYQQLGLEPDVVAFGKKTQVCGIMAGRRVDDEPENVFRVSSRINSTWGGNLTDMVRARRVLEVMESDDLIARARRVGKHLLSELEALAERHPGVVSNVRGRGLLCALDLPTTALRERTLERLRHDEQVLLLGSGTKSVRFRPALTVCEDELSAAVAALDRVLARQASSAKERSG